MLTGHYYNLSRPIPDKNREKYISFTWLNLLICNYNSPVNSWNTIGMMEIWVFEIIAKSEKGGGRGAGRVQRFPIKKEGCIK